MNQREEYETNLKYRNNMIEYIQYNIHTLQKYNMIEKFDMEVIHIPLNALILNGLEDNIYDIYDKVIRSDNNGIEYIFRFITDKSYSGSYDWINLLFTYVGNDVLYCKFKPYNKKFITEFRFPYGYNNIDRFILCLNEAFRLPINCFNSKIKKQLKDRVG